MKILKTINDMQAWSQACHQQQQSIAFVPTMGNLHPGHLSLVKQAKSLADKVVVSIYVNPAQFAVHEDLSSYPRTEAEDLQHLSGMDVDAVFMPTTDEMYPPNKADNKIELPAFTKVFEGQTRPDHFQGVAMVVKKLFDYVMPDYAIFGEKDFQQLLLIQYLVTHFDLDIEIKAGSIVRDDDGLAKSSRNQYLTSQQRSLAPVLYQTLNWAKRQLLNGLLSNADVELQAIDNIDKKGLVVDYFSIVDANTLEPGDENNRVILVAASLGATRLLDNMRVD